MHRLLSIALIILTTLFGCKPKLDTKSYQESLSVKLSNPRATYNTIHLFYNLKKLSKRYVIFGHQHSTAYGVNWQNDLLRSDVKDVTGSFPGLYGWDAAEITFPEENASTIRIPNLFWLITEARNRGGINAFSWHYNNPVTNQSFYDTTVAVKYLLPGQSHHKIYKYDLDRIARYFKHLVDKDGKIIPVIFRPFHELDGNWFWWGKNFCTEEEIKELWKFTFDYLTRIKNVKNVLFAFSPDRNFHNEEEYLERYPGDEYVDILGVDNYWDFTSEGEGIDSVKAKLKIVSSLAKKKNKIAAFTETGYESIPDSNWWTEKLLYTFDDDSLDISFVMLWRNADKKHHYAPYSGHISEDNFREFKGQDVNSI